MLTAGTGGPIGACLNEADSPSDRATVAVIIPTFNQARFLADAIHSVLAQTRTADEIIVVDDGSTDDPATVVAQFQIVRLIRQDNHGPSAARNTGLRSCNTSHVIFLDADDRLLPTALDAGLTCIADHPESAFVYGGHRHISEDGHPISPDCILPIDGNAHLALLRRNMIIMHATVLYRRDCLLALNGFDETLWGAEDYDLYLRIAQRYSIASHPEIVAEYRRHTQNASNNHVKLLNSALHVFDLHEARIASDAITRAALRAGRAGVTKFRVSAMLEAASARWRESHDIRNLVKDVIQAARWSPRVTIRAFVRALGRRAIKVLPRAVARRIERVRIQRIPVGSVRFGDLRRLSRISRRFGSDRGTPIDRYYIESFLSRNVADIRGRVLEVGDNFYTRRFGGARVKRSDVISVEASNPKATFVGDLTQLNILPEAVFDCIVLTQTLQYIFDIRAAVATLYRALTPGGVLLVTTPSVKGQVDGRTWGATWYWWFTAAAIRRLLEESFSPGAVTVEMHGNIVSATAFHYGITLEELDRADVEVADPDFPVIVLARAIKRKDA